MYARSGVPLNGCGNSPLSAPALETNTFLATNSPAGTGATAEGAVDGAPPCCAPAMPPAIIAIPAKTTIPIRKVFHIVASGRKRRLTNRRLWWCRHFGYPPNSSHTNRAWPESQGNDASRTPPVSSPSHPPVQTDGRRKTPDFLDRFLFSGILTFV